MTNDATLAALREVAAMLTARQVPGAVIGAAAVAVHGYPRATSDLDVATDEDPYTTLRSVAEDLRAAGFEVTVNDPEAGDPLGGVLRAERHGIDAIEIVNYRNPWGGGTTLGREAIDEALDAAPELGLPVVTLPHLIALKLYSGGPKSKSDIVELLARNPGLDREATRAVCRRHGLGKAFDDLLATVSGPPSG